jgi:hypothetical protein
VKLILRIICMNAKFDGRPETEIKGTRRISGPNRDKLTALSTVLRTLRSFVRFIRMID